MSRTKTSKSNLLIINNLHTASVHRGILIEVAEQAFAMEDTNSLSLASAQLLSLPLKDQSGAGLYYAALALMRQGARAQAARVLESVAGSGSPHFSNRALLALGVHRHKSGDYRGATGLYQDALRGRNPDLITILSSQTNLAVLESESGENRAALSRLESTIPIARLVGLKYPAHYLNHLNSLAVESFATGQLRAAQGYLAPCLKSPYLSAYPQWAETAQELYQHSRSLVTVARVLDNQASQTAAPRLAMKKIFSIVKSERESDRHEEHLLMQARMEKLDAFVEVDASEDEFEEFITFAKEWWNQPEKREEIKRILNEKVLERERGEAEK